MKEYRDYQNKLKEVEQEEAQGDGGAEENVPAAFLLVGAFISAAATYYLNEAGMKNSPMYARTIGAENAAYLVTAILEGSFLALTLYGHKILKSQPQRKTGKRAAFILKAVLSLNILVAFVMLAGYKSKVLPLVELYAQWGVPITVVGAIWLWSRIVANRRKTIVRNQILDDAAETERLWAEQHRIDQERYRLTYQTVSSAPEMQEVRDAIAIRQAIDQIARESNISYAEAAEIYNRVQERKRGLPGSATPRQLTSSALPQAQRQLPAPAAPSQQAAQPEPSARPAAQPPRPPARWSNGVLLNPEQFTDDELRIFGVDRSGQRLDGRGAPRSH